MVFSFREIQHCVASGHRGFGENWSSSYQESLTVIIFPNSTNFPLSQDFSHHCTCDSYGMALDKLISNLQITYWITLDDVKSEYSNVINKIFILIIERTRKKFYAGCSHPWKSRETVVWDASQRWTTPIPREQTTVTQGLDWWEGQRGVLDSEAHWQGPLLGLQGNLDWRVRNTLNHPPLLSS